MKKLLAVPVVLGGLALSGCAAFVTGGGFIESQAEDGSYAQFAFTYDQKKGKFSGTYLDKNATNYTNGGVKLAFAGTPPEDEGDDDNCMDDGFSYRSTNKAYPGMGTGFYTACDGGEGTNADNPDGVMISIDSGPYDDYKNADTSCPGPCFDEPKPVVGGNVQTHKP